MAGTRRYKPLRQIFAENVRQARKDKGLSQLDVAKAAKRHGFNISQSTVSRIERSARPSSADRDTRGTLIAEKHAQWKAVTLAPFIEGSITEFEKHHLRVLRTLNDWGRKNILYIAEGLLFEDPEATARPQRVGLRLVIDNTEREGVAPKPAA